MAPTLNASHLTTLSLRVAFDRRLDTGKAGHGRRRIAPILGGEQAAQGPVYQGFEIC